MNTRGKDTTSLEKGIRNTLLTDFNQFVSILSPKLKQICLEASLVADLYFDLLSDNLFDCDFVDK